jgi:hypothetical protein
LTKCCGWVKIKTKIRSLVKKEEGAERYQRGMGMKRVVYVSALTILLLLPALGFSAPFKVYPGAKLEDVYYEVKASETGATVSKSPKVIIFTTNDLFENVVAFYRGIVREYRMPGMGRLPMKLSSGQELKEAYFILDTAGDLGASKHWIKIQWPYLDKGRKGDFSYGKYEKIRQVTAIIEEDKRSYP